MRLLTGPAGSGKTARVLAGLREAWQTGDGGARLLVPTATLAEHLRNELARDGVVFRSSSVSTLAQWTNRIAPEIRVVDPIHFHLMVEEAVLKLDLPEFRKVKEMAGVHARLARTLSELDGAGCTPAKLARVRAPLAPFRDALVAVWEEVAAQMAKRDVQTRGRQLRLIAARVHNLPLPAHIWMDGFSQFSGPEIDLLCALGARTQLTVTLPEEGVPAALRPGLLDRGFREERITVTPSHVPEEVFAVPDTIEREADEIARRVIALARAGTGFREMGVILRQPAKYEPVLRAAFQRFHVPAHFYFSQPLVSHPSGRLLTGVVDALLNGWDHEAMLGLLRLAPLIGESDVLDQLEGKVRQRLPGHGLSPLLAEVEGRRLLTRTLQKLQSLEGWRGATLGSAAWAERLQRLPAVFWPGYIPDGASPGQIEQYRSEAAGLQAFHQAMATAAEWKRDAKPMSLAEFWKTAKAVVRLSSVSLPNRSRNVVHVISAYEARQWNLSVAFICGLVEKEFPAQSGRDPFLSDAALRDLERENVRVRTTADREAEELTLFEAGCARARDLLVLTHPRTDNRGQVTLPSLFLRGRTPDAVAVPVRPALPPPVAQWRQPSWIRAEDLLQQLATLHPRQSVTALESLLQCPFQFFAQRTLRIPETLRRPEDRLDFLLQGNIVHDVLKEWTTTREEIAPLFHRSFNRICAEKNVQPGYRTERLRRSLLTAVRRFLNDDQLPFRSGALLEQSFEQPIGAGLLVRGKLDRVDLIDDQHAVVIDYKFSTLANTKEKLDDETKLQGPLYAWAARELLGFTPSAMLYVSLKDDKPNYRGWGAIPGSSLKLNEMPPDWIDSALRRVTEAVAEFRSGVIHPRPVNQKPCRYCSFKDACRVAEPMAMPASGNLSS